MSILSDSRKLKNEKCRADVEKLTDYMSIEFPVDVKQIYKFFDSSVHATADTEFDNLTKSASGLFHLTEDTKNDVSTLCAKTSYVNRPTGEVLSIKLVSFARYNELPPVSARMKSIVTCQLMDNGNHPSSSSSSSSSTTAVTVYEFVQHLKTQLINDTALGECTTVLRIILHFYKR